MFVCVCVCVCVYYITLCVCKSSTTMSVSISSLVQALLCPRTSKAGVDVVGDHVRLAGRLGAGAVAVVVGHQGCSLSRSSGGAV